VSDEEKTEYGRFQRHCDARPDQDARIDELMRQGNHSSAELLRNYMLSDYIRATHADRARQLIKKDWCERIKYRDTDLAVDFANICFSHNEDASSVLD